ncbi:MAG: GntR family transcriptional regulator [Steroidobacteraceae bacterium]|jgi:DNA-binding GntR family transcriptional regulator|nr:GntR family transcriptional regulator [Steroidobacteraceae bacterium]
MRKERESRPAQPPRYRQLADELIGEIRAGRLRIGQTLPGELELGEAFGVSRHTVREALRMLEELGLIARQQGVGTVVTARESTESYVHRVRSPEQLMQYPPDSRLALLSSGEVVANRATARLLGCTTGTRWFRIRSIRRLKANGAAICWSDIYVLPEYAGIVDAVGRRAPPIYELIEQRFDERVATVNVDLFAGLIGEDRAGPLGVEPGTPSLSVVRRYTGRNRRVFEVSVSEHPAGRFTYSLELRRGWGSGEGWTAG